MQRARCLVANYRAEPDEDNGDGADQQADGAFVEQTESHRADGDADDRARQHDLEIGHIPLAPVGLEAHHIGQAENWQHHRHRLFRRRGQCQQRHGDAAQSATEATLGQPGEKHCRQGEQKEIVQSHGFGVPLQKRAG